VLIGAVEVQDERGWLWCRSVVDCRVALSLYCVEALWVPIRLLDEIEGALALYCALTKSKSVSTRSRLAGLHDVDFVKVSLGT